MFDKKTIDRFNRKYLPEPNSGCFLWDAAVDGCGYGSFHIGGMRGMAKAHRVSYQIYVGEIPDKLHVLHRCDVPCCVNPDHLFLGTHRDNMRDRDEKGRQADKRGEKNGRSTITAEIAKKIKKTYNITDSSYREVANMFGVKPSLVADIVLERSWKHI